MAIPPVPAPAAADPIIPVPAATLEAAPPAAPPAAAPWAADIAAALAAEDPAAALDTYMREKNQPYVTKLEERAKAAEDKSWLFDQMNDDPVSGLQELAEQVWGAETATRMLELVTAGATPEEAEAVVEAEAVESAVDLSKLPPEVREAVEFAQAEKTARAAAETAKTEADAQAVIETEYLDWHKATLEANPDLKDSPALANALHAYVASADDMVAGLAAFRADFPAPAPAKAPPTIGGATTGGIPSVRPSGGSMRDTMAGVWEAMAGTAPR